MEEGADEVYGGLVDKTNFIARDEIFFTTVDKICFRFASNMFQLFQEKAPSVKFVHLYAWEISSWAMKGNRSKSVALT